MIRSKKRIRFCFLLVILNILFIWGNSLLTREISSAISRFVGWILSMFYSGPGTPAEGKGHGILRKIAHFTEFCSLGVLLGWGVRMLREKTWEFYVLPLIVGIAVASVDEVIQIFVPGRGPHIRDVGIDTMGVVMGVLLLSLIAKIPKKRKGIVSDTQNTNDSKS